MYVSNQIFTDYCSSQPSLYVYTGQTESVSSNHRNIMITEISRGQRIKISSIIIKITARSRVVKNRRLENWLK